MVRKIILLMAVFLAGAPFAQAMNKVNTLGSNDAISNALISSLVDEDTAAVLLETPYKGFYQIESEVKRRHITFGTVVAQESFPDERWTALAEGIAALIEMPAYTTGTHIEPRATAYVVFYDFYTPGLDRSKFMLLPTTADSEPNVLAILVIEHKNHSLTREVKGTRTGNASENGNSIYFFELAM